MSRSTPLQPVYTAPAQHTSSPAAATAVASIPTSAGSNATPESAAPSPTVRSKRESRSDAADDDAAPAASSAAASTPLQPTEEMQSDSGSSSDATNPHLASVLANPAATAPVAKRTRRAQQSAQAAAVQFRSSSLMRLLGADSGARQSLLEMMDLTSITRLQCTGQSWRGWIAEAPFIGAQRIKIMSDVPNSQSRCAWIQRSTTQLEWADSTVDAGLDRVLSLRWPRLRWISASFCSTRPSVESLREGFSFVAATLQQLEVKLWPQHMATAINIFVSVGSLQQLESLSLDVAFDFRSLDLSSLSSLPCLQRFALCADSVRVRPLCSLAQVETLAQCKSLTDLRCGQWLPMLPFGISFAPESAVQLTSAQLQQIDDGLGRLIRLRNENGAAPLRRLYPGKEPMILPQCWRVLSPFTSLEELDAHWSCTLTAADWMLLATFPRLHSLRIASLEQEWIPYTAEKAALRALLDLGLVLSSLIHCRALHTLVLNGAFELRTEHVAMLAQVPSLHTFEGHALRVESLAPLSAAPALTTLRLSYCVGLRGDSLNIRAMIPAMPLVHTLAEGIQLAPDQAELQNAALRARLPKLVRFTHDGVTCL